MSDDREEPDHTDPGIGRDVGEGGYPEEQPPGADEPQGGDDAEDDD